MNILTILHAIFIKPLELIFELIFVIADRVVANPGIAIIVLSLTVNFLVLPLYRQADKMQEEERKTEEKLKDWVTHIKKTFRGDERFMMLQAYYRENDYRPYYALRGSLSLLLEIPFFIAAYRFLSTLSLLQGVSFGPIADLGAPDALINFGGLSVNLLPVLMTLINIVSGAVYTKGAPLKSKIQLYGMALIFLVFLYRSPSGLVFYWTLNNLFSLAKNIFYKLKDPAKALKILISVAGILLAAYFAVKSSYSVKSRIVFIFAGALMQLPLLWKFIPFRPDLTGKGKADTPLFLAAGGFLALYTGSLLPSAVIASSPAEFVDILDPSDPVSHVVLSLCLSVGLFVVWLGVFYYLSSEKGKKYFVLLAWIASVAAVVDHMFFGTDLGILSSSLRFDMEPSFTRKQYLFNLGILLAVALIAYLVIRKKQKIVLALLLAGVCACLVMSTVNAVKIHKQFLVTKKITEESGGFPEIELSRNGKNVIVIMMDRMAGYLLPYIFYEKPELYEKFDGFTYYPNTVSSGIRTCSGAPGLFGGYEYTAWEFNRRSDETMVDKHNESLKVMPALFLENGYHVTVCDPPLANYEVIPDLSIYDDYPEIRRYITIGRVYQDAYNSASRSVLLNRNLFLYGIMKVSPLVLQKRIYDHGNYNSSELTSEYAVVDQVDDGLSKAYGLDPTFMGSYNVLDHLWELCHIEDTDENTFMMMDNDTAHSPATLQEPDYLPVDNVDNEAFDDANHIRYAADGSSIDLRPEKVYWDEDLSWKMQHYQVNAASFLVFGKWLDFLRENGVYDNTRIIIVSDHATNLELWEDLIYYDAEKDKKDDLTFYNSMLLVKDFNAKGFTTDDRFMMNCDVPTIAMEGLIKDPVNPFTGNRIDSSAKEKEKIPLFYNWVWETEKNNDGYRYKPDLWFTVDGDVLDPESWECLGAQ